MDEWPEIEASGAWLRLCGPNLYLPTGRRQGLGWLARAGAVAPRRARLLCSQRLGQALRRSAVLPLALAWGQVLPLRRGHIGLLPAGSGPGSSILTWTDAHGTVAVATAASARIWTASERLEVPRADLLIVDASEALQPSWSHAALAAALARARLLAGGGGVEVVVEDPAVALEVAAVAARQGPVRLEGSHARWAHAFGLAAAPYLRAGVPRRPGLVRVRRQPLVRSPAQGAGAKISIAVAMRDETAGAHETMVVGWRPALDELTSIVQLSGARRVVALGAGALALRGALAAEGVEVRSLPAQASLALG